MSTTLTIRNLDAEVKQRLRIQAARHQRSMEAEAREILAAGLEDTTGGTKSCTPEEFRERLKGVIGAWEGRGTTDDLMKLTRSDD
ncbi:MAG: plasmid stabilization protein [Verrucomicrobiota bacterium]